MIEAKPKRVKTEISHSDINEKEQWDSWAKKYGYGSRQALLRVALLEFIQQKENPLPVQGNVVETIALEQELDRVNRSIAGVLARLNELDERGLSHQLQSGVNKTNCEKAVIRLLELRGEPAIWSVLVEDAGAFGIAEEELDATLELLMGDGLVYRDESGRWTLNGQ